MPSKPTFPLEDIPTTSGIALAPTGERHIPASVRPDGTVRREIRVRPGYRPPEDVEVYKNRAAEGFRTRGKGGVPGATFVTEEKPKASKSTSSPTPKSADTKKAGSNGTAIVGTKAKEAAAPIPAREEAPLDPEAEKEKEAKKLAKKLRQARDLQEKKAKGDALLPEQFEKVIRINELTRQLDKLGFDAEGVKKG